MAYALVLAERGRGWVSPNPMVGAVIVKNGRVVGAGWHRRFGGPHAEVEALKQAKSQARGATLYVTLEPCHHVGKTPPCAEAILTAGLHRVVVAMKDPNPLVSGKGLARLRRAGLRVEVGLLEADAKALNRGFVSVHTRERPYVVVKTAMTLDGKIATKNGDSQWVSSPSARRLVHRWRRETDAILVGVNTVLRDNPRLTPRNGRGGKMPLRVVMDASGRTSVANQVVRVPPRTLVMTTRRASSSRLCSLRRRGVEVWQGPSGPGGVDVRAALKHLVTLGVLEVLVEAGGTLNASLFEAGVVDHVKWFIAPKLVGGKKALTPWEGTGQPTMSAAVALHHVRVTRVGPDVLVEGDVYRNR